jgi:hypothetical protein
LKNTKGTVHDPLWKTDVPDYLRPSAINPDGTVDINSMGFGTTHPSRPHTPALRWQVSLLNADKQAGYYLFDERNEPVRVVLHDICTKIMFRIQWADAMFGSRLDGLEAMAKYLIKVMGQNPGLSRTRILDQFSREYDEEIATKMAEWKRLGVRNGIEPSTTFLETPSRRMAAMNTRF